MDNTPSIQRPSGLLPSSTDGIETDSRHPHAPVPGTKFRFAVGSEGAASTELSPADLIRGVWKGRLPADAYELVITPVEDSDEYDAS
ncbi:hypothetical protein [Nocardioides sp. Arc9.136]|uniref:hypothetical protein n=1 Tax=Nocardioides sp. Arc9.136 TaxID=2996826 RepID=UPI0026667542|nr:hypothetical protein [Nocardioides sp. Arc9.136]WKN47462.1 hypothetical protein OSR43_15650 [Nocardioides sp. Arc9.136]